jgi:hypothetical protein
MIHVVYAILSAFIDSRSFQAAVLSDPIWKIFRVKLLDPNGQIFVMFFTEDGWFNSDGIIIDV